MRYTLASAFCSCIFLITACNNTPAPVQTNEDQKKDESTNILKDVISKVSDLTDNISKREETLHKMMDSWKTPKDSIDPAEEKPQDIQTPTTNYNLAELAKQKETHTLKNALSEANKSKSGVEEMAAALSSLIGLESYDYLLQNIKSMVETETFINVLAVLYYKIISSKNEVQIENVRLIFKPLSMKQKKQLLGYVMLLNTNNTENNHREDIIKEANYHGLNENFFGKTTSDIASLKATLDAVVTGQEEAKIGLAVAISNHYRRLVKDLPKSNILIIGPSGTGKTFMVQTIAESLKVPFVIADSSNITQAGYIGGKVTDAVTALAQKADYNLEAIEQGIIFYDEIDKMAARSGRKDTEEFKRQAQATLLKTIEGIEVDVPFGRSSIKVNTKKILFVCAGAFTGLDTIISERLAKENKSANSNMFSQVSSGDLVNYGFMPELLGRLPNVITLNKLTTKDFVHILNNSRASILEEYKNLFKLQNIKLDFTPGAIESIAEKAFTYDIGARALRTVVETVMANLQFRLSSMGTISSCTVTKRVIDYGELPIISFEQ